MGITTGGNISVAGIGNIVDLNVTGPALFNTDIWVGGNIYNANMFTGKDGLYTGNLTVQGNLRYTDISVVVTDNLVFKLANNQSNATLLNGGGWTLGANNQGTFLYNSTDNSWESNLSLNPVGNGTVDLGALVNTWNNLYVNHAYIPGNLVGNNISGVFAGDGGNIANINANNIVGNVLTAVNVTGNAQPNITSTGILTTLTVSGNVYATNLIGNVTGLISNAVYANSAGNAARAITVTSNLQPNITLLGTLTTLSVSGNTNLSTVNAFNISATGDIGGAYLYGNGYYISGLPAGYANANAQAYFASGSSNANISITGNVLTTAEVSATGNVTGNYILGNGSQLTGIITSVSNVVNGNTTIDIATANANIIMSVSAVANVATVTPDGLSVTGSITATGNISANNIYVGNTLFTRTLTVGTIDVAPVTVPLASNNSFNVMLIDGANVEVYTT